MRIVKFAVLPLLVLVGCARTISIAPPSKPLTVMVYAQGKVVQRCAIAPGTEKMRKFGQLMQQNAAGWHSQSEGYEPELVVIGSDINLYFMGDLAVVNNARGEYSRPIPADTYKFLECKSA